MKRAKGLKADYRGATPEQVAAAMLKYRPGANRSCEASPGPSQQDSDDQTYAEASRAALDSACNLGRRFLETDESDISEEAPAQGSPRK